MNQGNNIKILTENGSWCWFSDPRAVHFKNINNRIYVGFVTSQGDIAVSFYDCITEEIKEVVIYPGFQRDDHVNPSLLLLPDGKLMVFFTMHNGGFYYTKTKYPEDISCWEEVSFIDIGPRSCYTNPVVLSAENNRIYVFFRGGYNWKPSFIYSEDSGESWSDPQTLIAHLNALENNRPYFKVFSDGISKIYFAITDDHPNIELSNSIYVFYYENNYFYQVDNSMIDHVENSPIDQGKILKAHDGSDIFTGSWIWDLALNHKGNPIIVYTKFKGKDNHQYYYAIWNGRRWEYSFISDAGYGFPPTGIQSYYSGGIVLDPEEEEVVYYSKPVNGCFEIFKAKMNNTKWTEIAVTQESEFNNIRPVVIKNIDINSPRLLWMSNRKYKNYFNYNSSLFMK